MFRKIIISLLLILSLSSEVFAECDERYQRLIDECNEALANWDHEKVTSTICLNLKSDFRRAYQIILDDKFRNVDFKAWVYLRDLEEDKMKFLNDIPTDVNKTPLDWIDEIIAMFSHTGPFYREYNYYCWGAGTGDVLNETRILPETFACVKQASLHDFKDLAMTDDPKQKSLCQQLAEKKIEIYKSVALKTLIVNKAQVRKDQRKIYHTSKKEAYDQLISKFTINLRYIDTIAKWWPSKTEKPK